VKRLIVIAALVLGGRASAQPAPDPKAGAAAAFAEGEKLYGAGKYLDAAERFRSAFEQDPDPVYLFNIAQAYRFGEDCVKSSEYYKRFLVAIPNPPNAVKVRGWADEMETCAKAKLAPKPDSKLLQPVVPVTHPDEHVPPPQPEKPAGGGGSGRTIAAIASGGVGVALLVVGAVFWKKTNDVETARKTAETKWLSDNGCTPQAPCPPDKFNMDMALQDKLTAYDKDGRSDATIAKVTFGIGGALAVTGVVLLLTGHSSESPPPVSVTTSKSGAMVLGTWSF